MNGSLPCAGDSRKQSMNMDGFRGAASPLTRRAEIMHVSIAIFSSTWPARVEPRCHVRKRRKRENSRSDFYRSPFTRFNVFPETIYFDTRVSGSRDIVSTRNRDADCFDARDAASQEVYKLVSLLFYDALSTTVLFTVL